MLETNIFYFLIGFAIMWFASGLIVKGIEKISRSIHLSMFAASFLILGVLTSLTEISVGLNSIIENRPGVFVGNLIGGSFVIVMLIIPILAIFTKGLTLRHSLDQKRLLYFLAMLAAPSFVILDDFVSLYDGILVLVFYGLFFYIFQNREKILDHMHLDQNEKPSAKSFIVQIVVGAILIYVSGKILVRETVAIADLLHVPALLVSLLVLSVGTNMPELMVAARSIKRRHKEIALGDYIGSAATNVMLFGLFTILNGPFTLETKGFTPVFFIIIFGYSLFFIFARNKHRLSPFEGLALVIIYIVFLLFQTTEILSLSPDL